MIFFAALAFWKVLRVCKFGLCCRCGELMNRWLVVACWVGKLVDRALKRLAWWSPKRKSKCLDPNTIKNIVNEMRMCIKRWLPENHACSSCTHLYLFHLVLPLSNISHLISVFLAHKSRNRSIFSSSSPVWPVFAISACNYIRNFLEDIKVQAQIF